MTDKAKIVEAAEKAGQKIGRRCGPAGGDASPDPDYDFSGDGDWQAVREAARLAAGAGADDVWSATDQQPAREWAKPIWSAVESGYRSAIIDDAQIEALRAEAEVAGDAAQVAMCDRAHAGNADARAESARVLRAAQAQESA